MRSLVAVLMTLGTTCLLTAAGCNALLDIDHIDFGDGPVGGGGGGTAGSGGTGTGGTTSTTSSGGGTGGTGGTAGDGGVGGTGGAPAENCTNGVDDNGDNLVDCEDPICNNHTCVDQTLPSGWDGPVVLYVGTSEPTCGGAWPTLSTTAGSGTLTAPPATCTNCSCGSAQGISCGIGTTSFWLNSNCNASASLTQTPAAANVCETVTGAGQGYGSARAAPLTPSGGTCPTSGGVATVPPASFAADVVLCEGATLGAGCPETEACAPPAGSSFEPGVCIFRSGNRTCDAPFSVKHIIYTSINDWRGCSSCTCTTPTGASCSGTTNVYPPSTNATCAATAVALTHGGSCITVGGPGSMVFVPGSVSGGTCSPSGGTPDGNATADGQTTVCCTP